VPIVLTVDQRHSRRTPDRVDLMIARLCRLPTLAGFERTAGDEFQGLLADHLSVVSAILDLVNDAHWSIGVGIGAVEEPIPASTRAARGPAYALARAAVEAAKQAPPHLVVRGADQITADDAEAALGLLAAVVGGRSPAARQAIELADAGLTQAEIAAKIGISRQAVGQRLAAAHWREERAARPALARLLARADAASTPSLAARA
jgi:uncharacterized protein YjiS (DUF1127 family)